MKMLFQLLLVGLFLVVSASHSFGQLNVTVGSVESAPNKALVRLSVENAFDQNVRSARVWVFLLDAEGKVVGNKAEWIIGGDAEKPPLEASKENEYAVVVDTQRPSTQTRFLFSRIIMEDGSLIDPRRHVVAVEKGKDDD